MNCCCLLHTKVMLCYVSVQSHKCIIIGSFLNSTAEVRCCAAQRDSTDLRVCETAALAVAMVTVSTLCQGDVQPPSKGNPDHPQSVTELQNDGGGTLDQDVSDRLSAQGGGRDRWGCCWWLTGLFISDTSGHILMFLYTHHLAWVQFFLSSHSVELTDSSGIVSK